MRVSVSVSANKRVNVRVSVWGECEVSVSKCCGRVSVRALPPHGALQGRVRLQGAGVDCCGPRGRPPPLWPWWPGRDSESRSSSAAPWRPGPFLQAWRSPSAQGRPAGEDQSRPSVPGGGKLAHPPKSYLSSASGPAGAPGQRWPSRRQWLGEEDASWPCAGWAAGMFGLHRAVA